MRNRVTPESEIVAIPLRGRFMGNRGALHVGHEIVRPWNGRRWLICDPLFRDRKIPQWRPGRWTALFFDDEAVALAAGHRPCAECRRERYEAYRGAWGGRPSADDMDRALHAERLDRRIQRRHPVRLDALPTGTFVWHDGGPALVLDDRLVPWTHQGYGTPRDRPGGDGLALTPPSTVRILAAGYRPVLATEAHR